MQNVLDASNIVDLMDDVGSRYIMGVDYDHVEASMAEQVKDIWRVQGQWPFPKWLDGRVVSIRRKVKPFNIKDAEEAFL